MSSVRIQWYRPSESRLDRPALDSASSLAASLPPVPIEISGLVLESVSRAQPEESTGISGEKSGKLWLWFSVPPAERGSLQGRRMVQQGFAMLPREGGVLSVVMNLHC